MTTAPGQSDPRDGIIEMLPALRAFARGLSRNASLADDLVQDTIVKAWHRFDSFEPGTNLQAWLFTILRNTYYSDLRKTRKEQDNADDQWHTLQGNGQSHDTQIALIDFEKALSQLVDEQREALILVGASGLSYEEAAQTCGVPVGTIKSRVNRGRRRLAELLGRR